MSNSLHLAQNDVLKEQEGAGDEELLQYLIASEDLSKDTVIPNQDEDFNLGQEEDDDSDWFIFTQNDDTESESQDSEAENESTEPPHVSQEILQPQPENQLTENFIHVEIEFCEEEEKQWDSIDTLYL